MECLCSLPNLNAEKLGLLCNCESKSKMTDEMEIRFQKCKPSGRVNGWEGVEAGDPETSLLPLSLQTLTTELRMSH